jgi:hypothetical protein
LLLTPSIFELPRNFHHDFHSFYSVSHKMKTPAIDTLFKKVTPPMHQRNILRELLDMDDKEDEACSARLARSAALEQQRKLDRNARVREYRLRAAADREAAAVVADPVVAEALMEVIDAIPKPTGKIKKWHRRPNYWKTIAQLFIDSNRNTAEVLSVYGEEFAQDKDVAATYKRLSQWAIDLVAGQEVEYTKRTSILGRVLDNELADSVQKRMDLGLPIDCYILRMLIVDLLQRNNLLNLLKENDGSHSFGRTWGTRFWKRHNFVRRAVTTKMREIPENFEELKATYINVLAQIINQHNVPPELVVGGDETAVLFVNRAKCTFANEGARRVRVIGVGSDKAQITVTIFINEAGDVLPVQMIFGGKTKKSLPDAGRQPPPEGVHWHWTPSHWQDEASYIKTVEEIIIPYKNQVIAARGLPADQKTVLKHDLHYSHKSAALLQLLRDNNIIPMFVPARCTDVMQECDTVVNAPFKRVLRQAFRDYLHQTFNDYKASKPAGYDCSDWVPNLKCSELKPRLTGWVQAGIAYLRTPEMRACIQNAFQTDGCMAEIRSADRRMVYLEDAMARLQALMARMMEGEEGQVLDVMQPEPADQQLDDDLVPDYVQFDGEDDFLGEEV